MFVSVCECPSLECACIYFPHVTCVCCVISAPSGLWHGDSERSRNVLGVYWNVESWLLMLSLIKMCLSVVVPNILKTYGKMAHDDVFSF